MTDRTTLKHMQTGVAEGNAEVTDPPTAIGEIHEETFEFDANDASGDVAELGYHVEKPFRLKHVEFLPDSALAADGTDYVTQTLAKREAATLATAHTVATLDTNTAGGDRSLVAWTSASYDATAAQHALWDFAKGDVLTWKSAKGGAPTAPKGKVTVTVEYT